MNQSMPELRNSLLDRYIRSPYRYFIAVAIIALLFFVVEAASADETKPSLIRTPILENAVELPSKNINAKVIRVTFPPHYKTPWHTHEGPGPRYVVRGKFEVTDNGTVKTYGNGEVFWETGAKMAVQNLSDETAELIIFEMAPGH
jgi:quercetin dioxygenase-like cupin family protein